jgi:adenine C2-methylase RlmN of 23S rRNA A2503 and tRNA A37
MSKKINLKALSRDEMSGFMEAQGLPKYRTEQLLNWIYVRYAASLDEITEFSKTSEAGLMRSPHRQPRGRYKAAIF